MDMTVTGIGSVVVAELRAAGYQEPAREDGRGACPVRGRAGQRLQPGAGG
jgi:hypothetical protein